MKTYRNKTFVIASFLLIFPSIFINGQTERWKSYLSYYYTTAILETPQKIYAVATPSPNASANAAVCGALYSYDPDWQEVRQISKVDGLNDVNIAFIAYSESENALLIIYENANIDILTNSGIYNISGIKNYTSFSNKTIYDVVVYGRYAYLSTAFGILVIDLQRKEVKDQYSLEKSIYSVCTNGEYIYAATSGGILYAPLSKDLIVKDNWDTYSPGISGLDVNNIQKILSYQDALIFCQYGSGIFYEKGSEKGILLGGTFKRVNVSGNQLIGISHGQFHIWTGLSDANRTTLYQDIFDISTKNGNIIWMAQGVNGIAAMKKDIASGEYSVHHANITINSPKNNNSFSVTFQQNKLLVTGGGRRISRLNIPGTLMVLEKDGSWFNFDENKIRDAVRANHPEIPDFACTDFIDVAVDPRDHGHYFVSTYGDGLLEFQNNEFVQLHNKAPSTLFSLRESAPYTSIDLGGVRFDSNGNLYIASNVRDVVKKNPLHIFTSDRNWYNFPYDMGAYTHPVGDLIITSKGQVWINFPRSSASPSGFFIVNDNGTLTDALDDKAVSFFKGSINDPKGELFSFSACLAMTEDHDGNIWVGTDKGPIIFNNPLNAIGDINNFYCTRPILPYNDGTSDGYYLLDTEQINTIAVDGANRKWLGTQFSGVYLVSENGMTVIQHFTAENSPLFSNLVNKIAINSQGEVFFATDKGLVSYMGDASEGKQDYNDVRVYPNPIRPEFDYWATVSNLIKDSNVKITDMRGNLIYQGLSKGGMFRWNCIDRNGERVKTGVYLVFAATPDGGEGVVAKITVIK
jgi:hypothetical protein